MSEKDVTELVRSIAQQAAEIAAHQAIEKWELQKKQLKERRYSKRLQGTKLLLKNYRILENHCKESAIEFKKAKYEVLDVLEELMAADLDESIFAENIKLSLQKTYTLVRHVSKMVELYKQICINSSRKEDQYKYFVINELFIKNITEGKRFQTIEEMAEQIPCHRTMIYKYRDAAMKTLSGLIFGLDGSEKMV